MHFNKPFYYVDIKFLFYKHAIYFDLKIVVLKKKDYLSLLY